MSYGNERYPKWIFAEDYYGKPGWEREPIPEFPKPGDKEAISRIADRILIEGLEKQVKELKKENRELKKRIKEIEAVPEKAAPDRLILI